MTLKSSTPCIGLCSTTFGDLVCRGCKRFVHEIVGWNGFNVDARQRIRERLARLRDDAVMAHTRVIDKGQFHQVVASLRLTNDESEAGMVFETLRRSRGDRLLADLGLEAVDVTNGPTVAQLRKSVDYEFLLRSQAHYEYSFRVPVITL